MPVAWIRGCLLSSSTRPRQPLAGSETCSTLSKRGARGHDSCARPGARTCARKQAASRSL
eukprot:3116985-Alexandrium_andersonii.AAC.1